MSKFDKVWPYSGYVAEFIPAQLLPYVLGLIENESGGDAGEIANVQTKYAKLLPSEGGGTVLSKKALGLMQTIPSVIADYNAVKGPPVSYEEMTGQTYHDAMRQLDVGIWAFYGNVRRIQDETGRKLFENGTLNTELLKLVLVAYAWGIRRTRDKLQLLKGRGLDPSFENLAARWPELGKPKNQPLVFTQRVFRRARKYAAMAGQPMPDPIMQQENNSTGAGIVAALALVGLTIWAAS